MIGDEELRRIVESFRISMAQDNDIAPDDLYIGEDEEYYHIFYGNKKCVSFEK